LDPVILREISYTFFKKYMVYPIYVKRLAMYS
jgi:hypothetical protein